MIEEKTVMTCTQCGLDEDVIRADERRRINMEINTHRFAHLIDDICRRPGNHGGEVLNLIADFLNEGG